MGTIWFLRRAQYARREDECLMNVRSGSYGSHRGSRRTHYARRLDVVSYKRALCDVWTPSSCATEGSVVWMPSDFATCKILTTLEPMHDTEA